MKDKTDYLLLALLAAGIFVGSYWFMDGFFTSLRQWGADPGWQALLPMLPGAAILFLVLAGRRAPRPYGAGLLLLGIMALFFFSRQGLGRALMFGLPLALLGIGFLLVPQPGRKADDARRPPSGKATAREE